LIVVRSRHNPDAALVPGQIVDPLSVLHPDRLVARSVCHEHRLVDSLQPLVDREFVVHQEAHRQVPVAVVRHRHRRVERRFKKQGVGLPLTGYIGRRP
jgi:hypothetical protein